MCSYSLFYENDTSNNIDVIECIANQFRITITAIDIWSLARYQDEPPHLGNVYQFILFSRLESELQERYPNLEIDYFINGMDSHFYINQEKIVSVEQFTELIEKNAINITTDILSE